MKIILILVLTIFISLITLFLYASLVIAKRSDMLMEEYYKKNFKK